MKILMVCLGNICRSPLAEGLLKIKLPSEYIVDSAGTIDMHEGQKPDHRSIEVAGKHNIDISMQRSRPLTTKDLDYYDIIYCMDQQNLEDVRSLADSDVQRSKVHLILADAGQPADAIVPDPYYGTQDDFENVYQILDEATTIIANKFTTK